MLRKKKFAKANELLDKLDNYKYILSLTPNNVYWKSRSGFFCGCNQNVADILGLSNCSEIIGKTNYDLFNKEIADEATKNDEYVFSHNKTLRVEERGIGLDGEVAIYLSTKKPLLDSRGNVIGLLGTAINITERINLEQRLKKEKARAEEALKIKNEFIMNMEHDIRTPFCGLYGVIDHFAREESEPEKKELLHDVAKCGKELLDYCNHILDFSKVESNAFPITAKSFDLRKIVASVMTMESMAAKDKGLDLSLHYDEMLPPLLKGDSDRIKRILINLISNAIKFTEQGFVKVSVAKGKEIAQSREMVIHFVIEDSGIGISQDHQTLIYTDFRKVSSSNKGLYKGAGVGLSIVKKFITDLDGEIHLTSKLGGGSKFTVLIPLTLPLCDEIVDE